MHSCTLSGRTETQDIVVHKTFATLFFPKIPIFGDENCCRYHKNKYCVILTYEVFIVALIKTNNS